MPKHLPIDYFEKIAPQLKHILKNNKNIKVRFILKCLMGIDSHEGKRRITQYDKAYIHSKTYENVEGENFKKKLFNSVKDTPYGISNYQAKGSGWYFDKVLRLEIHTVKYQPMKGSSYLPLPDFMSKKKAIINMKNKKDNKCFMWSIFKIFKS